MDAQPDVVASQSRVLEFSGEPVHGRNTRLTSSDSIIFLARGFDDLREAARIEAGAADQRAIDVRLRHQFARVFRFHASAVLDADAVGRGFIGHFAQGLRE